MQTTDLVVLKEGASKIVNSKTIQHAIAYLKKSKGIRIEAVLELRAKSIV